MTDTITMFSYKTKILKYKSESKEKQCIVIL